jgi:hypothetical protein
MDFKPEPMSSLTDRLPDALIDDHELKDKWCYPKIDSRDHVFDCEDNMRLVIARSGNHFHVVATPAGGPVFAPGLGNDTIIQLVIERTKQIGLLDIIGKSDITAVMESGGLLHLILQEGEGRLSISHNHQAATSGTSYGDN